MKFPRYRLPKSIYIRHNPRTIVIPMGSKKKKNKGEKKIKQKNSAAIDERFKKAMALTPPDENPFKQDNENKIDRFRYTWKNDWKSIKEHKRQSARHNRPKKPQNKYF